MKRLGSLLALCAAFGAAPALADSPIDGAANWTLDDSTPDSCFAEINGDNLHVKLLVSNAGDLVLVAARPDWVRNETAADATLQIDNGPREAVHANVLINLVLVAVKDADLRKRLRRASTLAWHLPWGDFQAQVAGLGTAFDAASACQRAKRASE